MTFLTNKPKEDILDFLKLLQRHDMVIIQQEDDAE